MKEVQEIDKNQRQKRKRKRKKKYVGDKRGSMKDERKEIEGILRGGEGKKEKVWEAEVCNKESKNFSHMKVIIVL